MNNEFNNYVDRIKSVKISNAVKVQTTIINSIMDYMYCNNVYQVMPLVLTTENDPLNHDVFPAAFQYNGKNIELVKSMILHKEMLLSNPHINSIFIMSQNIRLEPKETAIKGRHLIEFSQIDFEFKNKGANYIMRFLEKILVYIIEQVNEKCRDELSFFNRTLSVPQVPFKTFDRVELINLYGDNYEEIISSQIKEPIWIINLDRWFYDRKNENGKFENFDLIYPEGMGEGASGSAREYDYDKLVNRMRETGCNIENYKRYLKFISDNVGLNSAGAGFGFERLLRYICGEKNINDINIFNRDAGEKVFL